MPQLYDISTVQIIENVYYSSSTTFPMPFECMVGCVILYRVHRSSAKYDTVSQIWAYHSSVYATAPDRGLRGSTPTKTG